MDIREHIKAEGIKEGRQEGWQKGRLAGRQEGRQEGWQKGQQEGWQKGQQEGWQKGQQELILKMLRKKADLSFISEVTGLSKQEIKKLKNGSKK